MSSQQGSPDSINTEQELRELYNALDERDRHIEDLESQLEQKNQIEAFAIQEENDSLTVELDKHRDELIKSRDTIADLQIQIKQLRADNRELLDRKEQLEEDVTAHKIQENKLRSQLTQQAKTSEDVKRLRKDSNQQMQRLELENQHLRATIREIEENEDILVNEIDTLVQQKSSYQEHSEELSSKCDELYAELDEKTRVNVELSERNTKLQCDLEAEKEALVICESTWKKRHTDAMLEVTKLEEQLEKEMVRLHGKEYETNKIQLSKVQQENQRLISSFQQCVNEKNQAERDLDSAIRALNQSKTNLKEEVALGTRKERMISAKLRRELDKAGEMEKSLVTKCSDLEQQLDDANYRLDKLEQRNSMYEANHGLSEAVCHQQKLEADLRRRDYDIKELNEKLSLEIERRRVLAKTVESIREKGGCDQINEDEIKSALHSEDNVLRSENTELIRQVESLEFERTKLLTQLRQRAIEIGEKGTRFLGMDVRKVGLVMEFASNLANGTTDLPLNDRSKELTTQIIALKSEKEVDKVTIKRLEREIVSLAERNDSEIITRNVSTDENLFNITDGVEHDEPKSTLSSTLREQARRLLGEDLVPMPAAAETQFALLMKEYENINHEAKIAANGEVDHQYIQTQTQKCRMATMQNNEVIQDLASCASDIEHFRRCAHLALEKNQKLLEMIAKSDRIITGLYIERDQLLAKLKQHPGDNPIFSEVISFIERNPVSGSECDGEEICQAIGSNEMMSEMNRRLLYLETWKANAMLAIESQLKALGESVDKSSFLAATNDMDNLRCENTILTDKITTAQLSLLKYREIMKSLGYNADNVVVDSEHGDKQSLLSSTSADERMKALWAENCLLSERLVAHEEREHFIKINMDRAVTECSKIKSVYFRGLTAKDACELQKERDTLKSRLDEANESVQEYKRIADLSASQASAALSLRGGDQNEIPSTSACNDWKLTFPTTIELEQCESKLYQSQQQIGWLQNSCNALIFLVQKIIKNNWYRNSPISQVLMGHVDAITKWVGVNDELESSVGCKIKLLIDTVEELQHRTNQNEEQLEILAHEKEMMDIRLSHYQNSDTINNENKNDDNNILNQLIDAKSTLFSLQRELKHAIQHQQILKTQNEQLGECNIKLESDLRSAERLRLVNQDSKSSHIFGSILNMHLAGDPSKEQEKIVAVLNQVSEQISQYKGDLQNLTSKYSHVQTCHNDMSRMSKQVECLNGLVNEKNRIIQGLKGNLSQVKQENLRSILEPTHLHLDESHVYLTKSSPKPSFYEVRLEELSKVILLKDEALEDLSCKVADAVEAHRCVSKQLEESERQAKFLKTDISTLVNNLEEAEQSIAELKSSLSFQKQAHVETLQSHAENEKLKAKLAAEKSKLVKEAKENQLKIQTLEADVARTNRALSVARQGRARSDSILKAEADKAKSSEEELAEVRKDLNNMKAKLLVSTEDKMAASKRLRVATSKLKAFKENTHNPAALEQAKAELEDKVDTLNQKVSVVATQNSKLRGQLTRLKKEKEEYQQQGNRRPNTSNEGLDSHYKDSRMKARILSLEEALLSEKKCSSDNLQLLEMCQKRNFDLEQRLKQQNQQETKSPLWSSSSSTNEVTELSSQIASLSKENEELKKEIRTMESARDKDAAEKASLEKQNKQMSSQLEAFDLDFFEEIDELKYKYNEAVRQLSELTNDN